MDYHAKYLKYKKKYLQLKMELASNELNVDDTAGMHGGSNNIFIANEDNLGLPDALPDTLNSSDRLSEFENYLKGGEISDSKNVISDNNYITPTNTPLTITELNNTIETPKNTPLTTTDLNIEGGAESVSPATNDIFNSISESE